VTVVALERPQPPPAANSTWEQFLTNALNPAWRPAEWNAETWTFVGTLGSPTTDISTCLRPGCGVVVDGSNAWCSGCRKAVKQAGSSAALAPRVWTARSRQKPDSERSFCLAGLGPIVRSEVLYGLQEGDREQSAIRPLQVRLLAAKIATETAWCWTCPMPGCLACNARCCGRSNNAFAACVPPMTATTAPAVTCGTAPSWA
jgi:hypothetical protein